MQPMSDKELDKLFKDRFNTYEMEPSAGLWDKISGQLDAPAKAKKKPFSILWLAAASTAIVLGAGLWLSQPDELTQAGQKKQQMAIVEKTLQADQPEESQPVLEHVPAEKNVTSKVSLASVGKYSKSEGIKAQASENVLAQMPVRSKEIQPPAEVAKKENEESSSLASIQEVKTQNLNKEELGGPLHRQSELVLAQETGDKEEQEPEIGHHKIKSIGGLLNFVIAKVDKRENKIIEFKEGDEGAEVSGINLGFVKIKSRNNR